MSSEGYPIDLIVNSLSRPQLDEMVRLHLRLFPSGFLPSLGPGFLTVAFRHVVESPHGLSVVAIERNPAGERVLGYLLGATDIRSLFLEFHLRRWYGAVPHILKQLWRPRVWFKILETATYPLRSGGRKRRDDQGVEEAELLNFGVHPDVQGTGLAADLFHTVVAEYAERGFLEIRIIIVESNHRSIRFFQREGARIVGSVQVHRGENSVILRHSMSGQTRRGDRE